MTVAVLVIAVYFLVRPGSALSADLSRWKTGREQRALVQQHWPEAAEVASKLYVGNAPPDIIEFSDYECPYCRASTSSIDSATHAGLRIAVIQMPLLIHARARPAAVAALCAEAAGVFPSVHQFLMSTASWRTDTSWTKSPEFLKIVSRTGVAECIEGDTGKALLAVHEKSASIFHFAGTPTFITRTGVLEGQVSLERLQGFMKAR